jgi:hypothetical protein
MQIITTDSKHTLYYYRAKINPLINAIDPLMQVDSDLKLRCDEIPLKELPENDLPLQTGDSFSLQGLTFRSLHLITKLQANFLRLRHSEFLKLAILARKKKNRLRLAHRAYKKLCEISDETDSQQMHLVNIYSKGNRWESETLVIEVIPLKHRKLKCSGTFTFHHTKQLYSGEKPFYHHILAAIRVNDGIVKL